MAWLTAVRPRMDAIHDEGQVLSQCEPSHSASSLGSNHLQPETTQLWAEARRVGTATPLQVCAVDTDFNVAHGHVCLTNAFKSDSLAKGSQTGQVFCVQASADGNSETRSLVKVLLGETRQFAAETTKCMHKKTPPEGCRRRTTTSCSSEL